MPYTYVWVAYFYDGAEQYTKRFEVTADHEPEASEKVRVKVEFHEEITGDGCVDYFIEDIIE